MAPGSLFLSSLFAKPSTEGLTFYLFFSYKGRFLSAGEAGDHVVTLTSQLRPEAQRQARKIYGFDETHVSILQSNEVSRQLNDLLAPLGED